MESLKEQVVMRDILLTNKHQEQAEKISKIEAQFQAFKEEATNTIAGLSSIADKTNNNMEKACNNIGDLRDIVKILIEENVQLKDKVAQLESQDKLRQEKVQALENMVNRIRNALDSLRFSYNMHTHSANNPSGRGPDIQTRTASHQWFSSI
jgi:hypothetical protein